ncbi:MAG: TonB-dependent receptor, partial [Bacteroidetes bacterium]|nr:TonB-dependent receptor [Bacteroidota bacterium]
MKFKSLIIVLFLTGGLMSQSIKYTISGYVTEAKSGEVMIGAKVFIPSLNQGAATNNYGFYSLTVPSGNYQVEIRTGIYSAEIIEVELTDDVKLNVEVGTKNLNEIKLSGKKGENVNSTQMGQIALEMETIKTLPAFMGEVDVIKTIQLLPGVSSVSEGGQGFYVRGGGPDQNLVLLDEAVVYNAAHLFGFFSVFNADAVKGVNLVKGGMPANFGGRLSSVLEVNMNEGNYKRLRITGGIGAISSRLTVEGPIKKDKGSFIISGRRTYIDILLKAAIPDTSPFSGSGYYFYDFNFKANYKLG